jgi:Meiosis protein SPO22/ZIP4 like
METAGEERVRAQRSLRQLEDAAILLDQCANKDPPTPVSPDFPKNVSSILHELTTLSSRDDAERLLATGVSVWNTVITLEGRTVDPPSVESLVKIRHVAADAIYMATTVLGGISARFNIDEITLLRFYTSVGRKYASDVGDMEMAAVCFNKAAEFGKSAKIVASESFGGTRALSKAMFDLLLGSAECAWERDDGDRAEQLVSEASQYLAELPTECEFLASVQFNFGLFAYQAKEPRRAMEWLHKSFETRGMPCNPTMNTSKQAKTARLMGVCALALNDFEHAHERMHLAESICHDPVGAYLLLKLSILKRTDDVSDQLFRAINDPDASLEVCMGSVALLTDAQRLPEAVAGYARLFDERFATDPSALVRNIGPRYFETLCTLGQIDKALIVLESCCQSIQGLQSSAVPESAPDDDNKGETDSRVAREGNGVHPVSSREMPGKINLLVDEYNKWSGLVLHTASALVDRKEYRSAAVMLNRCIDMSQGVRDLSANATTDNAVGVDGNNETTAGQHVAFHADNSSQENVILANEASVCRLAASCGLCAASDIMGLTIAIACGRDGGAPSSDAAAPGSPVNEVDSTRFKSASVLLDQAMVHAQRAKELDIDDFAARLLLFRIHLLRGDAAQAAVEMERASAEISTFDAGALAEAACEAREVGSVEAVLAVLRCIIRGGEGPCGTTKRGFLGTVLVSAVNIVVERAGRRSGTEMTALDIPASSQQHKQLQQEKDALPDVAFLVVEAEELLRILSDGLASISRIGLELAFDDKVKADPALKFLADVAWNAGRHAGNSRRYEQWARFFDVCDRFSLLRHETLSVLQTRRIALLLSATAQIESDNESTQLYEEASGKLALVRKLTTDINSSAHGTVTVGARNAVDPILPLLVVLEARCCAGRKDAVGLAKIIENTITTGSPQAAVLEQLASISFDMIPNAESSTDTRLLRLDNASTALSAALDARLSTDKPDIAACSIVIRELIGVELCRVTASNRAFSALERALGLLEEHTEYPADEKRWLTATAWDTAQMFCKTGRSSEAQRWAEAAMKCATGNAALATYIPRMQAFVSSMM